MRHASLPMLVLALLLAGCATSSSRDPRFAAAGPVGVAFSRGGGLTGDSVQLIVTTDGSYTVERNGQRIRRGKLPAPDRARLREMVAAVDWSRVQPAYDDGGMGADAYQYAVSVTSAGGDTAGAAATDLSLDAAPKPLAALVRHLSTMTDEIAR